MSPVTVTNEEIVQQLQNLVRLITGQSFDDPQPGDIIIGIRGDIDEFLKQIEEKC